MTDSSGAGVATTVAESQQEVAIALSVIVPVYDQAKVIVENVRVIRERVAAGTDERFEIIVVSDGSVDGTAERILESELPDVKVLYYDRNLGKGYAIKTGAREARGRWIGYVDADLDLDPAALPAFVAAGIADDLDIVIGSKRHPNSDVHYPRSRVISSWIYQQLVRVLFGLDVRDTQVGLKVFRREVAEEVMPLLLVKRFAFDIELLAVARAFGYDRLREMPIALDYKFTGSGVRSMAVVHAVFDTLAVFYRLRILGYYQRRLVANRAFAWTIPSGPRVGVTVIEADGMAERRAAAQIADTEIVAFLEHGAKPSANWLTATTPAFSRAGVAAIVTPQLAPAGGNIRERASAAIAESRIGGGSLRCRFTPGAIRYVTDFPALSFLVRRDRFLALDTETPPEQVVLALAAAGGQTLYLPEASVTIPPAPLFLPQLRRIGSYGRARGLLVRANGIGAIRLSTVCLLVFLISVAFSWLLLLAGPIGRGVWLALWSAYLAAIVIAGSFGGLRFRSVKVGVLTCCGLVLTHAVASAMFCSGLVGRDWPVERGA
ncbi:MAG TPA: glycosyltransferase [Gaiellaceae bacterium]|nr:glycosyltransferase [Gaiellaceae bacterium]